MLKSILGGGKTAEPVETSHTEETQTETPFEAATIQEQQPMHQEHHTTRHHRNLAEEATQEEEVQEQTQGRIVGTRQLVPGAEQAIHYLDGIPQVETSATSRSADVMPQEATATSTYATSAQSYESPVQVDRTLAVYQPAETTSVMSQAPAGSTALVTVKSISPEERDRQIHEELMRKAQITEETKKMEASTYLEKSKRDAIAFMQQQEAAAQHKYDKEVAAAAYKEAQVQKKAADMMAEAAAIRKKVEIRAQQKLEERRAKAKTIAEEHLATSKVRGTAIQRGDVQAELGMPSSLGGGGSKSFLRKFSSRLRL